MARTRGPGNLVAPPHDTAARADARAHDSYAAMIDSDLGGRRATSYRAVDEGRPASTAELLLRPLALFLFACTAFVIVVPLWLWQAGIFGQLEFARAPKASAPSTTWMGARQAGAPPLTETGVEDVAAVPPPGERQRLRRGRRT